MAVRQRLTPTLFDKLVCDLDLWGPRDKDIEMPDRELPPLEAPAGTSADKDGDEEENDNLGAPGRNHLLDYAVVPAGKFNERALKATIRRELSWLLNTTQFEARVDLEPFPEVRKSVLNYGLPDLAGRTMAKRSLRERALEIRKAIRTFEPRLDAASLKVEPSEIDPYGLSIAFVIEGDITAAAQALPVKFHTEVNPETDAVEVKE